MGLGSLARVAGMSRYSFAVRFKETVGEPAMDYLTRWRMMIAADRLSNGGMPISVVAPAVGYESESAFRAAFERVIGYSPRQFAKALETGVILRSVELSADQPRQIERSEAGRPRAGSGSEDAWHPSMLVSDGGTEFTPGGPGVEAGSMQGRRKSFYGSSRSASAACRAAADARAARVRSAESMSSMA